MDFLQAHRPAYLFGSTAPDVQVVSGQEKALTHFFDPPIRPGDREPWGRLLAEHPELKNNRHLPPEQAAFIAGYLCHLQADWYWVIDIFAPVFGPWAGWHTFRHRLYLHDVLRSYLDRQILESLPPEAGDDLARSEPRGWLPFVADDILRRWRDRLAAQLQPGAAVQTVEVLSSRLEIPPEEYYRLMCSEKRMEAEIFCRLPRRTLSAYRERLLSANVQLLQDYLSPYLA